MYEAFYGLKEKPFSMLPDPGFLFLSKKHQSALTLLEYGLLNHVGFCVISGEAGAGKTTILRALLEHIDDKVTVGLITNTHQSFGGLLDWILSVFDLHKPNLSHVEMHQIFMEYLIAEYANNRSVLLIVDEAQNMTVEALEELRMLSNVNSEKDQLLQVVLAGQPALKETLRRPELMQFAQRIAVDYHLAALSLQETCGYIQHRLVTAGAQKDIFTPAACERIHNYSGGTPRLINLLCETVMVYGFADDVVVIDVGLVDEMVLERMKDSVVPIVNRDISIKEIKEDSKLVIEDFPWIRPEGGTQGLKPEVTAADALKKNAEISPVEKEIISPEDRHGLSATPAQAPEDFAVSVDEQSVVVQSVTEKEDNGHAPLRDKPPGVKANSSAKTFADAQKNIFSEENSDSKKNETRDKRIKYAVIAAVLALLLIVIAVFLSEAQEKEAAVVQDNAIELQKQQEQEALRLQKLQTEAEALKREHDAAIAKMREEQRAKEEAMTLAAEKKALEAKKLEEQRELAEKKRITEAKDRERRIKQAEAKAKQKAAKLEEERRLMQARLDEEIRLKKQQEALRLDLERQEKARLEKEYLDKQRQAALLAEEKAAVAEVVEKAAAPQDSTNDCNGPAARFKSTCR